LHQRPDAEPKAVDERELVLDDIAVGVARMRVVPFVRAKASEDKERKANDEIGGHHVDPDLKRQRRQERKQARVFLFRFLEQDTYTEIHERFREVDVLLANVADSQRCHGQVSFLLTQRQQVVFTQVNVQLANEHSKSAFCRVQS
jgi:hypothetical protein